MQNRHKPIKALILDQAIISGIGNWVADESLYHARLHPEQYCNEFSDEEIKRLYDSIRYVSNIGPNKRSLFSVMVQMVRRLKALRPASLFPSWDSILLEFRLQDS